MGSTQSVGTKNVSITHFEHSRDLVDEIFVDQMTGQILVCSQEEMPQHEHRGPCVQIHIERYDREEVFSQMKRTVTAHKRITAEGSTALPHEFRFVDGNTLISWTQSSMFVYRIDSMGIVRTFPVRGINAGGPIHATVFREYLIVVTATCVQVAEMPRLNCRETYLSLVTVVKFGKGILSCCASTNHSQGEASHSRLSQFHLEEDEECEDWKYCDMYDSTGEDRIKLTCLLWNNLDQCYSVAYRSLSLKDIDTLYHAPWLVGETGTKPFERSWVLDFLPHCFDDEICGTSWIGFNPSGDHLALLSDSNLVVISLDNDLFDKSVLNYRRVVGWVGDNLLAFAVEGKHGIMKTKVHQVTCHDYMNLSRTISNEIQETLGGGELARKSLPTGKTSPFSPPFDSILGGPDHHDEFSRGRTPMDLLDDQMDSLEFSEMSMTQTERVPYFFDETFRGSPSFEPSISMASASLISSAHSNTSATDSLRFLSEHIRPDTPRNEEDDQAIEFITDLIMGYLGRVETVEWTVERGSGRGARFGNFHFGSSFGVLAYRLHHRSHVEMRLVNTNALSKMLHELDEPSKMVKLIDNAYDQFYIHSFRESRKASNWKKLVW